MTAIDVQSTSDPAKPSRAPMRIRGQAGAMARWGLQPFDGAVSNTPAARRSSFDDVGKPEATVLLAMAPGDAAEDLIEALAEQRIDVVLVSRPAEVVAAARHRDYEGLLVHGGLGRNALELCRTLPGESPAPLIYLANGDDPLERLLVLELGADDCLAGLTHVRELAARIRAFQRRAMLRAAASPLRQRTRYLFSGWELCLRRHVLTAPNGRSAAVTDSNLKILLALLEHPRLVLSVEDLARLVDDPPTRQMATADWRVRIYRLRSAMNALQQDAEVVTTVHGRGYVLASDVVVRSAAD